MGFGKYESVGGKLLSTTCCLTDALSLSRGRALPLRSMDVQTSHGPTMVFKMRVTLPSVVHTMN